MSEGIIRPAILAAALGLLASGPAWPESHPDDLAEAAWTDDVDRLESLLAQGYDPRARSEGATPLHFAVSEEVATLLVDHGFDVSAGIIGEGGRDDGWTPLHSASFRNLVEVAAVLVDRGSEIEAPEDGFGNRPLHVAAGEGHAEMTEFLLLRGVDVNAVNDLNVTALYLAARAGSEEVSDLLLKAGADPLTRLDHPSSGSHLFLPLDAAGRHAPDFLRTGAGIRLHRATMAHLACREDGGRIVLAVDRTLAHFARRVLGQQEGWRQVAEANGLGEGKGYREGDCLRLSSS